MHTGQTQAHVSSGTSSSSPKSKSNAFVALPFCLSWSHRISRSTPARPKLLSSGTLSSTPKSESNAFVSLPFFSSWSHRISRCTQARPQLLCLHAPQALIQSQRAMNLSPCHFARHGFTGSAEAHMSDSSSFVFRHPEVLFKVREQCICLLAMLLVMVAQDQSKRTGQTQAPLSSGTSSFSP